MKLTKDEFCRVINALKVHSAKIEAIEDALDVVLEIDTLQDVVIELLEKAMDVEPNDVYGSDISYFVYDLDFGKNWTESSITIDGVSVDISTPERLYDYLVKY